jgi:hypothetical protein
VPARELAENPAQTGMAIALVQGWHGAVHATAVAVELGGTKMRCVKRLLGQRTGSHGCLSGQAAKRCTAELSHI